MKSRRATQQLARQVYRRRRVRDMARLLPVVGVFLFMLPLFNGPDGEIRTAVHWVYLFVCWFGLIACAAILARALRKPIEDMPDDGEGV